MRPEPAFHVAASIVLPVPAPPPPAPSRLNRPAQSAWLLAVAGTALVAALLWVDWQIESLSASKAGQAALVIGKLVAAAAIGLLVTGVSRRVEKPLKPVMEHAQVLLAVAGALMMMLIDGSLARAFGIFGAASIIRFRTPVKDPKAVTVLFLLLGLGMAAGMGAFSLAGLGAGFLCVFLLSIGRATPPATRVLSVTLPAGVSADGMERRLACLGVQLEPREVTRRDGETVLRYLVTFDRDTTLKTVTEALLSEGPSFPVRALAWESVKAG